MRYVKYVLIGLVFTVIAVLGALCFESPQMIKPSDYIDVHKV